MISVNGHAARMLECVPPSIGNRTILWLVSGVPDAHQLERIMSKSRHSTKEAKKQPLMSPKEKRAAKHQKKHAPDGTPIIVPH
ncbi:hypothetical protein [Chromobacterium subtsugae]|uniref:hypothetical protein n=1 Tax=Chromobacterium subtsugae TaxID=251747 RepID=UPI000640FF87|nr:hypothetical protein [Chromobacterium subtsugae]KUM02877.1 hypothetical protein Cv017_22415 [Chromobacterium subtsugae]OBU86044.1 hypothetical protein MY55_13385 [Chromobacterium subtsugae]